MNKTQYKNRFGKYFQQITNSDILSISSNKKDTIIIHSKKNNRKTSIQISSHIQMCEEGILNFSFECEKCTEAVTLEAIYESATTFNAINLYEAQDSFCKEQALEFCYNEDKYFYVLIYTDMVERTLEFFDEKLSAEKFKKVAF